jgi:asparagine synthetase B (glutamine-hydrolysing)
MFDLDLELHKKVRIIIKSSKYFETQGKVWFGFPVGSQIYHTSCTNLNTVLNSTSGYFCFIYFDVDKVIIANDILGGFRLYTYECNDTLIIADDYYTILSEIRKKENLIKREVDEVQLEFWKKHGYTFGDRTLFKGLNKVVPGTIITGLLL